jgi:hypothetical protein
MRWGDTSYIFTFPCSVERVFDGMEQENSKHKEETDGSGKFKRTRRKEWRKEKEEIFNSF